MSKKTLVNEEKDTAVSWSSGVSRPRENSAKLLNSKAVGNILGKSVKFEIDKNVPNDADRASETASSFSETIQESTNVKDVLATPAGSVSAMLAPPG